MQMAAKAQLQSVLYVDDDPDVREVVQTALCLTAGLTVHVAGSGDRAIEIAHDVLPDLMLLDVMMPGLDGPATLLRMRASAMLSDIPIIFLTAKVMPAEIARLHQLGAIGVIPKPFDPLKLGDIVSTLWAETQTVRVATRARRDESAVQAHVGSLAESFVQRARGDAVRLRKLIGEAQHGNAAVLAEIERVAHSIHGAAAMFGFPAVSESGEAIERLVGEMTADTADPGSRSTADALYRLMECGERLARNIEAVIQAARHAEAILESAC
jgi:two-component system OmpR family response regulator